jgi:four helix bundle protein
MRDHTKLRAFELADELVVAVYKTTQAFPREEVFGLTSQLRRAAVSIPSNIVEGCARHSEAEYLHFLDMAYGSAREVEYQIGLAHRLGYLDAIAHEGLRGRGLLRSLRRS